MQNMQSFQDNAVLVGAGLNQKCRSKVINQSQQAFSNKCIKLDIRNQVISVIDIRHTSAAPVHLNNVTALVTTLSNFVKQNAAAIIAYYIQ